MKKQILTLALALVGTIAYAQKPEAGSITGELQLNFQTGSAPISLTAPTLRGRYFLNAGMAVRTRLSIASSSSTFTFNENPDGTGGEGTREVKSSSITFAPGIEKHFAGTDKLSPYMGVELAFTTAGGEETWDKYDGATYEANTTGTIETGSTTTIGLNLVFGADYYVASHLYIGGEVAWGYRTSTTAESTTTVSVSGTTSKTVTPGPKSSGFVLGTTPGIRIGWLF